MHVRFTSTARSETARTMAATVIVFLANRYGEQLRVQLGSPLMALVTETAINHGWAIHRIIQQPSI